MQENAKCRHALMLLNLGITIARESVFTIAINELRKVGALASRGGQAKSEPCHDGKEGTGAHDRAGLGPKQLFRGGSGNLGGGR